VGTEQYSYNQSKYIPAGAGLEGLDVFFNADFIGLLEEGKCGEVGDWGPNELERPSLAWLDPSDSLLVLSPLVSPWASSLSRDGDGLSD
jgi:hypothetical protein